MSDYVVGWDDGSPEGEHSVIMLARTTQFRIYRDPLTRQIMYEIGEYDLILNTTIRAAREVLSDLAEKELNKEFGDMFEGGLDRDGEGFARYFVRKVEQRLLFQLGLERLP